MGNQVTDDRGLDLWAFVELFGHSRLAGRVTERALGSTTFLQVDVYSPGAGPPVYSRIVNSSAVYSLTPTDEATARRLAGQINMPAPVPYLPPRHPPLQDTGDGSDADDFVEA